MMTHASPGLNVLIIWPWYMFPSPLHSTKSETKSSWVVFKNNEHVLCIMIDTNIPNTHDMKNHRMTFSWSLFFVWWVYTYRQISNIWGTLVGDQIHGHSDVAGASPVGEIIWTNVDIFYLRIYASLGLNELRWWLVACPAPSHYLNQCSCTKTLSLYRGRTVSHDRILLQGTPACC